MTREKERILSVTEEVAWNLRDHLTFYHEYLIPDNSFFRSNENYDKTTRMLIVSSPSRMGNHLLHSMLDGHKEVPSVPGEDGVLFHLFKYSNNSLYETTERLRSSNCVDQLEEYASTGGLNKKWKKFKECYDNNDVPEIYSGIQYPTTSFYITDYQGLLFDINYEKYHNELVSKMPEIQQAECMKDVVNIYYKALNMLDYNYGGEIKYDMQIVASGMRVMSRWALEYYTESKLLCSLRPFEAYATSHLRSRYKSDEITNDKIREAWEHWFHKIIDYTFLKLKYPEKVVLVNFDNIISDTENTVKHICDKLNIEYDSCLLKPTAFNNPTKGNSSISKDSRHFGRYYKKENLLSEKYIPDEYSFIWGNVKKLFLL